MYITYFQSLFDAFLGRRVTMDPDEIVSILGKTNYYNRQRHDHLAFKAEEVVARLDGIIEDLRSERRYDISDRVRVARNELDEALK